MAGRLGYCFAVGGIGFLAAAFVGGGAAVYSAVRHRVFRGRAVAAHGANRRRHVGVAALVVVLCVAGKCPGLKDYQQERIRAFVVRHADADSATKKDLKDANYQAEQGMNALRRGGLVGAGPGVSLYKHGHVPEPHTDFILAIIGEEWGLVGTMALLTAFGALIFFCFQIGHNAATSFESLFCAGVGSLLAIQVVANTGVVTGLLPVTGVVLPLVSYGGTGLIVMLFAIGNVLGISRRQCDLE